MTKIDREDTRRLFRVARKYEIASSQKGEQMAPNEIRRSLNNIILEKCGSWTFPEWRYFEAVSSDTGKRLFEIDRSVVGGVGGKCWGVCNTLGMVATFPGAGSINIIVPEDRGDLHLNIDESPMLELLSTTDQIHHFEEKYGAVNFQRLVYYGWEEEAIYNEIQLRNYSLEKKHFTFYVSLAPISSRGFDPIESIRFDESSVAMLTNEHVALVGSKPPSSVLLSTADSPEIDRYLYQQDDRVDDVIMAESGLATALMRYDVELGPAEQRIFYFASPLKETEASENRQYILDKTVRTDTVERWYEFLSSTSVDDLPDDQLTLALNQSKARIGIQIHSTLASKEEDESVLVSSEIARVLLALARMDSGSLIEDMFKAIVDSTLSNIRTMGTIDPSIIWSILKLASYEQPSNPEDNLEDLVSHAYRILLEENIPQFKTDDRRVPDSIDTEEEEKSSFKHEEEKNPQLNHNDATSFETIHEALWCWAVLDEMTRYNMDTEQSQALEEGTKTVLSYLREALALLKEEQHNSTTHAKIGLYWITKAAADIALVKPSGLDWGVVDNIMDYHLQGILDMPNCQHSAEGVFGNHLLRIASYYAYRRKNERVTSILEEVIGEINTFHQVPNTIAEQRGENLLSEDGSISAAADLILLLQTMLFSEENGNLLVFPSIAEDWYASEETILVSEIPSSYGRVSLEVGTSTNQLQLEIALRHLPEEIFIFIPRSFSISMAKSFGGTIIERIDDDSNPYLRVVPLSDSIVLTFPK
ncbi:MAG: hypothetical protein ACOC38_11160 [Promethearchaeia archaeon]